MALKVNPASPTQAIQRTQARLEKSLSQLSSLQRITQASDDAAGLAISEKLRAVERALHQGTRNLSDGISLARTAEGGLSQTSDNLIRMRELTVQAGNGALGETEKQAIQAEFDQLAAEITRTAEATSFGQRKLLTGEISGANAVSLRDGSGGDDVIQVSAPDQRAAALGVEGLDVSDASSLDAIDSAIGAVSATRAGLGAAERRLESGIQNLRTTAENTASAHSRIRDADVALTASSLAKDQLMQQAQVATAAQAHISGALALELLR